MALCIGLTISGCASTGQTTDHPQTTRQTPTEAAPSDAYQPAVTDTTDTDGLTADLLYDLLVAQIGYQREQPEIATEALARAARNSSDPALLAQASRTALHYDKAALAAELGEKWIHTAPEEDAAYIVTALAYLAQGDTPDHSHAAGTVLTRFIEKADKPASAYQALRGFLARHPLGDEILPISHELVALHPDEIDAWLMHAALAEKLDEQTALDEALDQLLRLDPQLETAAQYRLAAMERAAVEQAEEGNADNHASPPSLAEIRAFAEQYLANNPAANRFRLQYAQLLLRHDAQQAAIDQYQTVLQHHPDHPEALHALGLLYYELDDFVNAERALLARIEQVPNDDRSRIYLGLVLHELKRYDDAIATLERVRDDEMRFGAQRQIALSIEEKAGADAALVYLDALYTSNQTETVQLINDRISLLRRAERLPAAREIIDDAVASYPDNDSLRYNRALFLVELEDLAQHEADMQFLLNKEPENPNYLNTLGYTLLELSNRVDEARALIEKAFELKPGDPYITDSLGWVEFKSGNYAEAEKWLKAAYALDPDAEIAAHLGEVYWVQGREAEARDIWAKGKASNPENKALKKTLERLNP